MPTIIILFIYYINGIVNNKLFELYIACTVGTGHTNAIDPTPKTILSSLISSNNNSVETLQSHQEYIVAIYNNIIQYNTVTSAEIITLTNAIRIK